MEAGSFRRVSVTDNSTFTSADHGPIIGGTGSIPRHTLKKALLELNETEERKKVELEALRKLFDEKKSKANIENQEEAMAVYKLFRDANDDVLLRFLRARKFDTTRAWDLMHGYVSYRIKYPNVLTMTAEEARHHVEKGQPGVLSKRDSRGRVVMFFKLESWDPDEYPFTRAIEVFAFVLERLLLSAETQINGVCIVEDFSGYTLGQVAAVGVTEYKQMVDMLQGSFPCRFKGIFCIRQPWYFTKAFNVIKPLLKAKIFERVHIHGNELDSFFNEFPANYLPEDLGGTAPPYDGRAAANMLFGNKEEDISEETAM